MFLKILPVSDDVNSEIRFLKRNDGNYSAEMDIEYQHLVDILI